MRNVYVNQNKHPLYRHGNKFFLCLRNLKMLLVLLMIQSLMMSFVPAQVARVELNLKNVSVDQVLKEIKRQTNMSVVYNLADINLEKKISVEANNEEITVVLDRLIKDLGVSYKVQGNHIVFSKEDKPAASLTVKGNVTDSAGEPLIGVSVLVEDSKEGTITDIDGNFSIPTVEGAVLRISYLGYQTQSVVAKGAGELKIVLMESSIMLDDVVVTALGIKRSQKALSYNVQQIKSDDITTNKDANLINSLAGKVAGVTINASSSGVGGASKVVMRGIKSIMQSSNALYVIDGVPMSSKDLSSGDTEFGSRGTSEPIADLNPEDIESMSVLTGAAAAALYGSEAANGAIVITTKKGHVGRATVTVTSNTELMNAFVTPRFQNRYGTGSSLTASSIDRSWGRPLNAANYYGYDPVSDYFQTGIVGTETVSLSTGTDKNQTYASVAAVNSKGIVPNNKYDRYNFSVRNTTSFLDDKMTLDVGAGYILQKDRNMTNQGTYHNPLVGAYLFPRGNDWEEVRMFEHYDPVRKINKQFWDVGDGGMVMQNPYWINYRNLRENDKNRYMMNANLSYQVLDWLSVSGRVRIDNSINDYTAKMYATTIKQLTELSDRGYFEMARSKDQSTYADALVNINKILNDDWTIQANIGTSYSDRRLDDMQVRGPIADGSNGEKPGLTNFFVLQNLDPARTRSFQDGWREQAQSVFASAEIGYKSTYFLTLTGRNDWPSQLAGPKSETSSFFYPSAGLSVLVSELIPNMPSQISYLKLRSSYAKVGNAFQRYIANPRYEWQTGSEQWSNTTQYPMYDLQPEWTESVELGLTARFLAHFQLDLTYYSAVTRNQTFNPQLPVSGFSRKYIQTGKVRNSGIELSLNYNNTWGKFGWDTGYTLSTNRNKILSLAKDINNLNMGGLGATRFILKEGGSMGDIYSSMDLKRDSNGAIYVGSDGNVSTESIKNSDQYIKLGSVLPDANMAWRNNMSWNNFRLGFMVSARLGGVVFSRTQAVLDDFGVSEASALARDKGFVQINGGDHISPERWYNTIGGGTAVPQYYTYSATNVRLQEASIGYSIPRKVFRNACDVTVSLVGRNLLMIYNKAPFDPEGIASMDNFYAGIDYFMMPSLRSFGLNLNVKF